MGLDIHLIVNNHEEIALEYFKDSHIYSLSREFCNLICRPDVIEHKPELDQIGEITNINISYICLLYTSPSPRD